MHMTPSIHLQVGLMFIFSDPIESLLLFNHISKPKQQIHGHLINPWGFHQINISLQSLKSDESNYRVLTRSVIELTNTAIHWCKTDFSD